MSRLILSGVVGASLLKANPAAAYAIFCGGAFGDRSDELIAVVLTVTVVAYGVGLARALARAPSRWPVAKRRVASFFGAIAILVIALLSPLNALAEKYFAAHMGQHLLLVLVAAPLLAISDAHLILLRVLPLWSRRRLGAAIGKTPGIKQAGHHMPVAALLVCGAFVFTLTFWHVPAAYDWALVHPWVHAIEHTTLLLTALAFWRIVTTSGKYRLSLGMAVVMVSLVGIQGAFMGAIISFASHPLYAVYAGNDLSDQSLAGVMMCIPASFIYLGSTVWALSRMLRNTPRREGVSARL